MILPQGYVALELVSEEGSIWFHNRLADLETPEGGQGRPYSAIPEGADDDQAAWARIFLLRTEGNGAIPPNPAPGIRVWLPGEDAPLPDDPLRCPDARLVGTPYLRGFLADLGEGIEAEMGAEPAPEGPVESTPVVDPEPEPAPDSATEPAPLDEEGAEPGSAWSLIPDDEIDALSDEGVYGWITTLARDYSIRPPRNSEFLPVDDLRAWIRETVRSDQVRATWERRQQEAAERDRRADLAFPTIRDYVEVSIRGDVSLRITPFPGGYAIVARTGRGDQIYRHGAKTPPWRSDKIIADTTAGIAEAMARGGHGAEADVRGWVGAAWDAIRDLIHNDPDAEIAVQSPTVKKALENLLDVLIQKGETTLTEVVYDVAEARVSLEFDAKSYTGNAACLNERWYNAFAPDEISADKDDWATIKRFWGRVAEITSTEGYSSWDGIIEQLQEHLTGVHFRRELRDLVVSGFAFYDDNGAYLEGYATNGPRIGGVIWIPSSTMREFIERYGRDIQSPTAFAKILRSRGILLEGTRSVSIRSDGRVMSRRAWPFDPQFLNFRPEWVEGGGSS